MDDSLLRATDDQISLLFGGIGDARHLFATLIRIMHLEDSSKMKKKYYHITIVDQHPATIARNFVLVLLLLEL